MVDVECHDGVAARRVRLLESRQRPGSCCTALVRCRKPSILAQRMRATVSRVAHHALSPGQTVAVVVLGLSGVAAFGLAPDTTLDDVATRSIVRALPVPELIAEDTAGRALLARRADRSAAIPSAACLPAQRSTTRRRSRSCAPTPSARPLYQLRPGRAVQSRNRRRRPAAGACAFSPATASCSTITRHDDTIQGGEHRAADRDARRRCARARSARRCSPPRTRSACPTR